MDREQDQLRLLGFFGILRESLRTVFSKRKILGQITLAFILPLTIICLFHTWVSSRIIHNDDPIEVSPPYLDGDHRYEVTSGQWAGFWLFKAAYFVFLLVLSLVSTSAVVYIIACIYTGKEITFRKVMSVVPKVWKRLVVTFLCGFALVVVYDIAAAFLLFARVAFVPGVVGRALLIILVVLYFAGLAYITIIWSVASVASVLEDLSGFGAMKKSRALIKGKLSAAGGLLIVMVVLLTGIQLMFDNLVVLQSPIGAVGLRVLFGVLSVLLMCAATLLGLVIQTVLYFVCKSHHHELIDRASLSNLLEVYRWGYVPLKSHELQMQQTQV